MTQNPNYQLGATPEDQWQTARASAGPAPQPTGPVPQSGGEPAAESVATGGGRPSNLRLAGAGGLLAVLAFLGGMAVGHSWDGTSNQQNQFGGPGGGQFPGRQGQFPGQGTGQGQGNTGQGQGNTGQGNTGQGQGTVPGQQGQGTQPGTGTQNSGGQTQTS